MRCFWVGDKVAQDMYALSWHPGQENLVDYQSKHHIGFHHIPVCPWYLHQEDSPCILLRALRPRALKGCVGTLKDRYLCKVPLPRVPRNQSTIPVAASATFPVNPHDTGYSPDPKIPLYNNLTRLLLDVSKLHSPLCLAGWFQLAINSIEQPFVYPVLIAIISAINNSCWALFGLSARVSSPRGFLGFLSWKCFAFLAGLNLLYTDAGWYLFLTTVTLSFSSWGINASARALGPPCPPPPHPPWPCLSPPQPWITETLQAWWVTASGFCECLI